MVGGQWVTWGLAKGSADLIGLVTIEITGDMVGQKFGRFLSVEIKTEAKTSKLSDEQVIWKKTIADRGGIAEVFRSGKDAQAFLKALAGRE